MNLLPRENNHCLSNLRMSTLYLHTTALQWMRYQFKNATTVLRKHHNNYLYAMPYNFPRTSIKTWLLIVDEEDITDKGSCWPTLFESKM